MLIVKGQAAHRSFLQMLLTDAGFQHVDNENVPGRVFARKRLQGDDHDHTRAERTVSDRGRLIANRGAES